MRALRTPQAKLVSPQEAQGIGVGRLLRSRSHTDLGQPARARNRSPSGKKPISTKTQFSPAAETMQFSHLGRLLLELALCLGHKDRARGPTACPLPPLGPAHSGSAPPPLGRRRRETGRARLLLSGANQIRPHGRHAHTPQPGFTNSRGEQHRISDRSEAQCSGHLSYPDGTCRGELAKSRQWRFKSPVSNEMGQVMTSRERSRVQRAAEQQGKPARQRGRALGTRRQNRQTPPRTHPAAVPARGRLASGGRSGETDRSVTAEDVCDVWRVQCGGVGCVWPQPALGTGWKCEFPRPPLALGEGPQEEGKLLLRPQV